MKIKLISILSVTMLFSSCSSWIDSSMNTDPNNPKDVSMALLVAPIEANLAYVVGGDLTRTTNGWMQQLAGLSSQSADNDVYNISEADVNNAWSYNLYNPGMYNTKVLMAKAVTQTSPHYGGIAKILMAYHLGVTTDLWGDIPYSDAFNAVNGQTKSKYDTQQAIYTTIFTLLNGAITDLSAAKSTFEPGAEDLIYGGDLTKWTKTAHALMARYKLHLIKQGIYTYQNVLDELANAYTGNADDLKLVFGSAYSNSNPMFQFADQRDYVGANTTMMDLLKATNDPRLGVYFLGTDTSTVTGIVKLAYFSSAAGESNGDASRVGANYASAASPVYLMSYAEVKFIEAEARLSTDAILAATAYNDGLKASLDREGVYDATWYNANKLTAGTITLEKIINQKYLSGFLQIETFNDWRRTGFPKLTLATGAFTTEIPRRLPYPSDERLYNGVNEPSPLPAITSRVWWDKQ
jgi:hypothetical protein